jgi:outer membrane protein
MRRLAIAACLLQAAFGATKLTLKEAEQIALRTHPQLQGAEAQEQVAAAGPSIAKARLYPQATVSTTGVLAEDANTRIQAGGINNPIIYNRLGMGVGISQLITDFGRTRSLTEAAEFRAQAAHEATRATRAEVLLRVNRVYFNALRAQAVLQVAQETVKSRELVANQARELAANKLKSDLDVTFARVNLDEAKLLASNAANDERSAMVELSNALGLPDTEEYILSEEALPQALPPDWNTVAREAQQNRPELKQVRLEEQAAASVLKAEKALMFPTIGMYVTSGFSPLHIERLQNHWNAGGVSVDLPFLNGGLFKARQAEAQARQQVVSAASKEATNRIARDVKLAFLSAVNAFERLQLTATLLDQAKQSLQLAQARYDLGLSNMIELSQAQLNLTRAQIAQASARFEYQSQRVLLEFQKGSL